MKNNFTNMTAMFPKLLIDYITFYYDLNNLKENDKKKITTIFYFLQFLSKQINKNVTELSIEDLENIELSIIQLYLTTGKNKTNSVASQNKTISILSSFWNYFTNDSFTLEIGKPIFYRNAINEWKIVFRKTYAIINTDNTNIQNTPMLSEEQLKNFLMFIDFYYITTLDTIKKIENWKKVHERDLAIVALLIGTGITLEEISKLNFTDFDMRKKVVLIYRNGKYEDIPIFDFTIPYIKSYLKTRKFYLKKFQKSNSLFLNSKNKRPTVPFYVSIINKFSKVYSKKQITSKIIRKSHGNMYLQKTGNLKELQKLHGSKTLNGISSYIK